MKTLKTILQEVISGIKAWVDTNTVHKSGNETIDGTKTFSAPQCYSSNAILFNSSVLPTQGQVPSANINPLRQYIGYGTSYANSIFIHDTEMRTNGRNHYRWTIYSDDHSANAAMWLVYNPDSEYLRYLDLKGSCVPDANDTYHLGIPTQKWKTLNGVNPGALSLPDYSRTMNIDTTNWPKDGNKIIYTPTVNGWLQITIPNDDDNNGIKSNMISILDSGTNPISGIANGNSNDLRIYCLFPVIANREYWIYIKSYSNTITTARIVQCQGNV